MAEPTQRRADIACRAAACLAVCFALTVCLAVAGCSRPLLRDAPGATPPAGVEAPAAPSFSLPQRTWSTDVFPSTARPAIGRPGTYEFLRTGLRASPSKPPSKSGAAAKGGAAPHLLVLPIEFEGDNGAQNGNANLLRFLPAYEWPRGGSWRIQHLDLITVANAPGGISGMPGNPEPVPGPRATGLSDLVHVSFFSPEQSGSLIWGAGAALGIPTATEKVLGSGKWSAGPALRLTYRKGPWNLGVVGAQRWSFAGDEDRADVNQLMLRCTFRRQLGEHWYLVSAPIVTANWNAVSDERWLLPLGGGIGRKFDFAGRPWAASVQGYANVVRPTGAPTWSIRLSLTAFIPLGR